MKILFLSLLCLPLFVSGQEFTLTQVASGKNTSLRGLSVVNDSTVWVSGSNGWIGRTTTGGVEWQWVQPKGFEKLDFRDIEAFDDQHAVALNAGSPAYILLTSDGGKNWEKVYENIDSAIFLDGMAFWGRMNGIVFGDPIARKMPILKTIDGGKTWTDISSNLKFDLAEGEASFAASGSTVKALPGGRTWIATGGKIANIYFSADYGANWERYPCPILQGEESTGPFSIDFLNRSKGIAVGGDYRKDKENTNNVLLTTDGGKTWRKPQRPVKGYRSGVVFYSEKYAFATGTSGTDVSLDGGANWLNISARGFNAVQRATTGKSVWLAGAEGTIYVLGFVP
ncbi:oxidoreductase [Pedobacter sp. SYP-B3415]|uniref:WD40/YVTN/BNR-like repeat-containing protein n=1 Tax=Pedobacter sp. SYP-B3415 TaxID=2496641 RepID=UPI001F103699|nr:oxidoreductase [Pedobacter sp. SYP-B3415]